MTEWVEAIFKACKESAPKGFQALLVEYPGRPEPMEYYGLRIHRASFDRLSVGDQRAVINWLQETLMIINEIAPISLEAW